MARKKIKITKQKLYYFYCKKKMFIKDIANLIGCCRETVASRIKESGLQLRKLGVWQTKYKKQNFSGDKIEKAYILGFRLGDLYVRRPYKNSEIVVVNCHTTKYEQISLMEEIFQKYGQIIISKSQNKLKKQSFFVNCNLNKSFFFLLISKPYRMEKWITNNFNNSVAFMAGYSDAEGNFILNQNKARFKIDSYDFSILSWMHEWLTDYGITSKLRLLAEKGSNGYNKDNKILKNNLWRFNINEAFSLLKFCAFILPLSKHKKRVKDMIKCLSNIIQRKDNETI